MRYSHYCAPWLVRLRHSHCTMSGSTLFTLNRERAYAIRIVAYATHLVKSHICWFYGFSCFHFTSAFTSSYKSYFISRVSFDTAGINIALRRNKNFTQSVYGSTQFIYWGGVNCCMWRCWKQFYAYLLTLSMQKTILSKIKFAITGRVIPLSAPVSSHQRVPFIKCKLIFAKSISSRKLVCPDFGP